MKSYFIASICVFLCVYSTGCNLCGKDEKKEELFVPRRQSKYPYEPDRAKAELVSAVDISAYFSGKKFPLKMDKYQNRIYIAEREKIVVFDAATMKKVDSFTFNLEDIIIPSGFMDRRYSRCISLAIFADRIFMAWLITRGTSIDGKFGIMLAVLQMDLDGKNPGLVKLPNIPEVNKILRLDGVGCIQIGYNAASLRLWVGIGMLRTSFRNRKIYFFEHNDEGGFTLTGIVKHSWPSFELPLDMDGSTAWTVTSILDPISSIQKFDIQRPGEVLHTIYFRYLGNSDRNTVMFPHDIVIDGENLLTITKKDGKLQLLTIRPLE